MQSNQCCAMEKKKKKKDCKLPSIAPHEANESNQLLRMEDQNQSSVRLAAEKNPTVNISSHDNAISLNHQVQSVGQWPQTTLHAMELQSSLVQSPSSTAHQVQHGQPLQHLPQPTMPFWPNNLLSGVNSPVSYQPFSPIGTTDVSWQGPVIAGGGIPTRSQAHIPNFCYHVSYPYPGFPGPWDPTSRWGQPQPSLPPCTYTFPRACTYISSLPPQLPGCSASSSQNFQRGTIQSPSKLSQKHQQLWGAQSAENVQLWAVVGQLQTELADYKSRLMKLESEVLSLKPNLEEPNGHGTGTSLAGKSSKRGRPKKLVSSVDALPTPHDFRPRARGGKPKLSNVQSEFEKERFRKKSINKVEGKHNSCHSTIKHPNRGDVENLPNNCYSGVDFPGTNSLFHNQIHHDVPGASLSSSELKACDDKSGASVNLLGSTNGAKFEWNSNAPSKACGIDLTNINSQRYYSDINVAGRNSVVKWSFGSEEGASIGIQNATIESSKDGDEDEEMEDEESSTAEDIA